MTKITGVQGLLVRENYAFIIDGYIITYVTIITNIILFISHLHVVYFILKIVNAYKKPVYRKINDTCIFCLNEIKEEVYLKCSHSFCGTCVLSYARKCFPLGKLECPICRCISKKLNCENKNYTTYDEIMEYNNPDYRNPYLNSVCLSVVIFYYVKTYLNKLVNIKDRQNDDIREITFIFLMVGLMIVCPNSYYESLVDDNWP
jgi:large-conductance mechanosensitive channel